MLGWLKGWVNQVIVAIIIAVIFELILPNGKNKKYIKMIINLYVLFVLVNPIVSKFINLSDNQFSGETLKKYFKQENAIEVNSNLDSKEIIQNTFEKTIKDDIKNKLALKGYKTTSLSIYIYNNDENNMQIKSINIEVQKDDKENKSSSNSINEIEKINIGRKEEKQEISKKEVEEIKKILSEEYSLDKSKINVNQR